jgi:ABC-type multidrug transport system fused ATPase/permease subunit
LLGISIIIQMSTSLLDLVGVLLIGLVGALAVTTVQSQPPPPAVAQIIDLFGLEDLSDQALVSVLAGAAALVLLSKSIFSSYFTRRVLVFLANRQALVSARLSKVLLSRPLTFVQKRSSQETAYALIAGAGAATSQILGQLVIAATELALLIVLASALLLISPLVALGAITFFAVVAIALQRAMGGWASRVGTVAAQADIASLNAVQEALSAYREITVSNRRHLYVDRIRDLRWQAAKVMADTQFIGMFPKYMFEAALVIGGFALAGYLFTTQDSVEAVGTLALFLAAGTRVMPSLLRLQGAALMLRSSAGAAGPTFELAEELATPLDDPATRTDAEQIKARIRSGNPNFSPTIKLESIAFRYPGAVGLALDDVSLNVAAGASVALVGKSGAGKSTLADVLLGVLDPDSGLALLGGVAPAESLVRWPGGVAYVPQDVVIAQGNVRNNVALGLPDEAIDDELVWEALARAHLAEFLRHNREGLSTSIGERGMRLSGGQRQRVGIARALYTRPRLLVLDEATSALDAETEQAVSRTLSELEGAVTTVVIAHRLSTIRNVDTVVYLDSGKVQCQGSFDEVVVQVPAFSEQARLMGLK